MSSTVICLLVLVFLIRFDTEYDADSDKGALSVFLLAIAVALGWDILNLIS